MFILSVEFGGARLHPGDPDLLAPVSLLGFAVMFAVVVLPLCEVLAESSRIRLRARRAQRNQDRVAAAAEQRARALMGELCPHGWQAQITMVAADDVPDAVLHSAASARVALDWVALEADRARAAVVRRVWAPTIADALDAMVADRRTDETLEQIEQRAFADGAPWPD